MKKIDADFWRDVMNDLFTGRKYIWVDAFENHGWMPETRIDTFEKATSTQYSNSEDGWFSCHTNYGLIEGLESIMIDSDKLTITMYSNDRAGGQAIWRTFTIYEPQDGDWCKFDYWRRLSHAHYYPPKRKD